MIIYIKGLEAGIQYVRRRDYSSEEYQLWDRAGQGFDSG